MVTLYSYLVEIFSEAKFDSAGEPGRRWSADAFLQGSGTEDHSQSYSPPDLDTPAEDTARTGQIGCYLTKTEVRIRNTREKKNVGKSLN